jgi:CMP-N,N'-diacetyllegionaminic acid synthase
MYQGKRVLAVVPARGGSKGVKLKNLRPVGGVPLVALAGKVASQCDFIDRAVVSTDHDEIAKVAEDCGLLAPFRRPESLSGDRIGDWDVLTHALQEMETRDRATYDIVLMLQPTSPSRKPDHVRDCTAKLVSGGFDSVWTVSETDSKGHPLKQFTIAADDAMNYYDPAGAHIIARQQLKPVYHRNGICYAITRHCLVEQKSIKGERCGALVIAGNVINIDTEYDLALADFLIARGLA